MDGYEWRITARPARTWIAKGKQQMQILHSMQRIEANKTEILETLRKNREKHSQIVKEARVGYLDRAQIEINKRLEQLRAGKVVALTFSLSVPLDYTRVYDTAIRMLELHQQNTITLDSTQVACLVMDQWEWTRNFYTSNSRYSASAAAYEPDESE